MLAYAGPKEDALAVFDRFLAAVTAADIDSAMGVFWPDVMFFSPSPSMPDLATALEPVRKYFATGMSSRKPNEMKATSPEASALVASDSVVLISGLWQTERVVDGKPTLTPYRISIAVTKRAGEWRIAQFHTSTRPVR